MSDAAVGHSRRWLRVALFGSAAIIAFDIVAALASRAFDFRYADASFGSWLIYLVIGFVATRASLLVSHAAFASGAVGLVEATLGWWLSSLIVPLQVPINVFTLTGVVITVMVVSFTAAAIGSLGGLIGKRVARVLTRD